jgi:hypothetical protein
MLPGVLCSLLYGVAVHVAWLLFYGVAVHVAWLLLYGVAVHVAWCTMPTTSIPCEVLVIAAFKHQKGSDFPSQQPSSQRALVPMLSQESGYSS